MRRIAPASLLLLPLFVTACERSLPSGPDALSAEATAVVGHSKGATVTREDWGPEPVSFSVPSACLGGNVLITGTISGWDIILNAPNDRLHITEYIDMTDLTATFGDRVWTASPGSHEIWSFMIAPGGMANRIHVGNTMFTSEATDLKLKFMHRIHVKVHPDGTVEVLRDIFEVQCIGPNR